MIDRNINVNSTSNPKAWTDEEMRLIEADKMDEDQFADRLYEQVEASPALINMEQVDTIEKIIRTDMFRRAALLFATSSGAEICDKILNDRDFALAAADVFQGLDGAETRYRQLADLLAAIHARLLVALAGREDMQEILDEAKSH